MTSRGLLTLLLQRWYLVLAGAAITLGVATTMAHPSDIYWTQYNIVLLPPTYDEFPNELENSPYDLTQLAGLVAAEYNGPNPPLMTSSSETTIYGMGVQDGVMVRVPNKGNQWIPIYSSSNIDVQVAADSPEHVSQRARVVTAKLQDVLKSLQDGEGVDPSERVTMTISPSDPVIIQIPGSRLRALGAIGIVGITTTIAAIYWLERLLVRRRAKAAEVTHSPLMKVQPPEYASRRSDSRPPTHAGGDQINSSVIS